MRKIFLEPGENCLQQCALLDQVRIKHLLRESLDSVKRQQKVIIERKKGQMTKIKEKKAKLMSLWRFCLKTAFYFVFI